MLFLDVTKRKEAEEALRQAKEQLEDKVQKRTAALTRTVDSLQKEIKQRERAEYELKLANEQLAGRANQLRALAGELTMAEQVRTQALIKDLARWPPTAPGFGETAAGRSIGPAG